MPRSVTAKVTPKMARFVDEYLVDLNATQAAIRAGYSAKTAHVIGIENLGKPVIKDLLAIRMKEREQRVDITQDRVLKELARIAFFDIRTLYREDGSLKAMHELSDDAAAVLAGVDVVEMAGAAAIGGEGGIARVPMYVKKVKIPDKVAALSLAMKHLGMLVEKVEVRDKTVEDYLLEIARRANLAPGGAITEVADDTGRKGTGDAGRARQIA